MNKKQEQRYSLEVTESQLHLIAQCVEDCHRFAGGQVELFNTTCMMDNRSHIEDKLKEVKPFVTPLLSYNACYGWSGHGCTNGYQRKFIAQTYCIYREIIHQLTIQNEHEHWSVYESETLTCEESGALPKVTKITNIE